MKRLLILAAMICTVFSVSVFAEEKSEEFISGDYEYTLLEDGTAEIKDLNDLRSEKKRIYG